MYPLQQQAIFDAVDASGKPARITTVEASTKSGKTISAICRLYEHAALGGIPFAEYQRNPQTVDGSGKHYWWVAPIYRQTEMAFERMVRMLPQGTYEYKQNPPTVKIFNGAIIEFRSAERPDGLYGEDVWSCVVDEASRVRAEAYFAVRSTLTATRGPLLCIGNVKGRRNWFYELCRRAEAGEDGMAYHRIVAGDAARAGVLFAEEIRDAKRTLPRNVFRELYLAEPSDDSGNPFGFDDIRACVGPMSQLKPVAFGIDLAKSVDWTVIIGVDYTGAVCHFERWQRPWSETIERIPRVIRNVPTLIDATGVGDPVVELIQRKTLGSNVEGYVFGPKSKQALMEELAVVIQNRQTRYPGKDVCPIQSELEMFEYHYARNEEAKDVLAQGKWPGGHVRYEAPPGYHDDTVIALGLAHECKRVNGNLETWRRLASQDAQRQPIH